MKLHKLFAGALALISLVGCAALDDKGQWQNLSGSFDGWNQIGNANWRIEGGEFVADEGNGHLVTKDMYGDVQIRADFWVDLPANSGIFMRASNPAEITQSNAYEVNIFDTRDDQTYRTGGVVEFAAPSEVIHTDGQWNTYDITMRGNHITVILNGVTTVDINDDTYVSGPISLQYAAGIVKYRNVQIRQL